MAIQIVGEEPQRIPEGAYSGAYLGYEVRTFMGRGRVYLSFEICEGKFKGTKLPAYFNVELQDSRGRESFGVLPRSKYLRTMRRLFSELEESGEDFLSPDNFEGRKVRFQIETVRVDARQQSLHERDQYSKIGDILSLECSDQEAQPVPF